MQTNLKRIGIIVSVIFNIVFIGGYCYRTFWQKEDGRGVVKAGINRMFRELQLSLEQKEKIRQSLYIVFDEASRIRSQIRSERLEMIDLLTSLNPDRKAMLAIPENDPKPIEVKRQKIALLQQNIQRLIINNILENKDILTSEQQKKIFAYLKEKISTQPKEEVMEDR